MLDIKKRKKKKPNKKPGTFVQQVEGRGGLEGASGLSADDGKAGRKSPHFIKLLRTNQTQTSLSQNLYLRGQSLECFHSKVIIEFF